AAPCRLDDLGIQVDTNRMNSMNMPQRLRARERLIGLQSFSGSPHIVELAGHAGFDVVMIDTEHAGNDIEGSAQLLRAASASGAAAWLRVGKLDEWLIAKALDLGA